MNAKKAKRIRKALKQQGINVAQDIYLERKEHVVLVYSSTTLTDEGKPLAIGSVTAQSNYLAEYSGRAIYKEMKKVNA